jgi:hypothetical protein
MRMPWGKHKGRNLADIDDESYLRWALEHTTALTPTLREGIRHRLGLPPAPHDSQAVAKVVAKVRDVLRTVQREMSLRFHPDKGGNNTAMAAIINMYSCLH